MASPPLSSSSSTICKSCGLPGAEIQVNPCSCMFHVRCFPTSFFFEPNDSDKRLKTEKTCPASCGCCERAESIYLLPMNIDDIMITNTNRSPNRNNNTHAHAHTHTHTSTNNNDQHHQQMELKEDLLLSLAPIFLMQSSSSNSAEIIVDEDIQIRNGRWTSEEVEFVEMLMKMFNQGTLSIPNGISLNNFLRSIFLCKGTRLRKKIKNANFCTRLYDVFVTGESTGASGSAGGSGSGNTTSASGNATSAAANARNDSTSLSKLQHAFIQSIEVEDDRNLLNFSLKRMWSTHFFNFCVQIGFNESIHAKEWLDSIERIEQQVVAAKENKKQRERRCRVDSFALNMGKSDPHLHSHQQIHQQTHQHQQTHSHVPHTQHQQTHQQTHISHTQHAPHSPVNQNTNDFFVSTNWNENGNGHCLSYSENQGMPKPPPMVPFEIQQVLDDVEVMSDVSDSFVQSDLSSLETKINSMCTSPPDYDEMNKNMNMNINANMNMNMDMDMDMITTIEPRPTKRRRIEALIKPPNDNFDVTKFCHKIGDWSPFVRKIAAFLQSENLPFQYFDVWYASSRDSHGHTRDDTQQTSTKSGSKSGSGGSGPGPGSGSSGHEIILKHVGHSTRDDIESIWSLYHMNQFGKYSSRFAFNPGEGLPGRVLTSGLPTWDDSIQNSCTSTFPRVDGARSHGVKKGLGIPMFHTSLGQIVVAMYSVDDVPKDVNLVQKCCMHFQTFNPNPKWEVILDVGGIDHSTDLILPEETVSEEEEIANLLSRHASYKSDLAHSFMSLRLLLLQNPSKRAVTDNSAIDMLKASYRNYLQSSKNEESVASLLVREWIVITSSNQGDASSTTLVASIPSLKIQPPTNSVQQPTTSLVVSTPGLQIQPPTKLTPDTTEDSGPTKMQLSHTNYALAVIQ